ncbi:phosphoglycerate mutase (2,3-diphosphoglycerate-independent) [Oceanisphaera profunda]|uniref:2,3-bisphosphoglycerate-independent phosphoglycerate mutase n=1 Tax=Oceanisphaera profunda TaxID=1416627 RepID=A0A1Y0D448_9GAMM|nr:2,3-bisphosphoglycerate-independent phosphoglycerate mutase [Oceanisphaera profunda]ART82279.1 phosphoglycerate mutase (2,3-diphosphoglycerate-independent) [Oceanisphaera profunda]
MNSTKKPLVLIIMDGWGYSERTENNAIHAAHTPVLDGLLQDYPSMLISTSGYDVGLPDGQMGNSEVGHVNIGAGRIVYQDFTRIGHAISSGEFFRNPALTNAVDGAVAQGKAVHIMGLLSDGGVHSHEDQIATMIKMAADRGAEQIYLHAFLDGRDVAPRSAHAPLERFTALFSELGKGRLATIIGRYFAMDRDNRWERVQVAYDLLTQGKAQFNADNGLDGLQDAYERGENDEFITATTIGEPVAIQDGDAVIFMNYRADRARELTRAFVEDDFSHFERQVRPALSNFVMLTEYAADIKTACAYPPEALPNTLGEWLADHDKTQLRISETEKYAHVTFFFNGGREACFKGEQRVMIPSPAVATYDLQPEMNSALVTDKLVEAIKSQEFDVIICNYPNGDMVGHTGVFEAAVKACEAIDIAVGRVVTALKEVGGEALITADHGNAEQMVNPITGQVQTAHTNLPVPLIYVGRDATPVAKGRLSDLAPTMLHLLGMEIPEQMTGKPLMVLK